MAILLGQESDERVPEKHLVTFHPFPPRERFAPYVESFTDFQHEGITVPALPDGQYTDDDVRHGLDGYIDAVGEIGSDAYGLPLIELRVDRTPDAVAAGKRARRQRFNNHHRPPRRVTIEDAWKIGTDSNWVEPEATLSMNYDQSRPPFSRLMDATLGFLESRHDAFNVKGNRKLFNTIRHYLGLSGDYPGLHWHGTGPLTEKYHYRSTARRNANMAQLAEMRNEEAIGETNPLLLDAEQATRGFLASVRGVSDITSMERAMKLTEIFAAYMTYLDHYQALTEDFFVPRLRAAAKIAQAACAQLFQSKQLEDVVDKSTCLNHASWVLHGETFEATSLNDFDDNQSDGGWGAAEVVPDDPATVPLTPAQALDAVKPFFAPLRVDTLKLTRYLNFSRRRIVAVLPPNNSDNASAVPAFTRTHYRLRTVPAPWSDRERWRRTEDADVEDEAAVELAALPAETNVDELDVWVDVAELEDLVGESSSMVGMGLRGCWAEISAGGAGQTWWIVRLRDYILPAFWSGELEEQGRDGGGGRGTEQLQQVDGPAAPAQPYPVVSSSTPAPASTTTTQ